jgi:hypothetical protein
VKTFALAVAAALCFTRSGLGGDDSKNTANDAPAAAPIEAVAMPRLENNLNNPGSGNPAVSQPQNNQSPAPATPVIQPAAATQPPNASPSPRAHPDQQTEAIGKAAEPKFDDVMDHAAHEKTAYGFENEDNLEDAKLGDPLPIYTISEKDATNFSPAQDVESILKPSGHWLVPVTVKGALRTFISVSENSNHEFEAGGASVITARVWKTIASRWPAEKGFHPKLVSFPGIPGYYFTIPELQPQNLTDIVEVLAEADQAANLSPALVTLHSWR